RAQQAGNPTVLPANDRLPLVVLERHLRISGDVIALVSFESGVEHPREELRELRLTRATLADGTSRRTDVVVRPVPRSRLMQHEVLAELLEVRQIALSEVDRRLRLPNLLQRQRARPYGLEDLVELLTPAARCGVAGHRHVRVRLPPEIEGRDDPPPAVLVLARHALLRLVNEVVAT